VKVSFLGDISLNDAYTALYQNGCRPFEDVSHVLSGSDMVVGNLECLAEGGHGENTRKRPRLKTSIEALGYIKDLKLSVATLAHNHVYDNLLDGFQKTVSFLAKNNIAYLGAGLTAQEARRPHSINRAGVKICFLNYVSLDTNPNTPEDAPVCINFFSLSNAIDDIRSHRAQADYIVVLLHWGGRFEGGFYPDRNQPRIAHGLIDAGADLIIGGHSHTLQPFEVYRGKYVFYSLGNFCFADINFEGLVYCMQQDKYTESVIVTVDFGPDKYTVALTPVRSRDLRISVDENILQTLRRRAIMYRYCIRHAFFWWFYALHFMFLAPIINFLVASDEPLLQRIRGLGRERLAVFFKKRVRR